MNGLASHYREMLRIDAGHPSLPGHFPGNPIVPGVVLLDRVAAALERRCAARVAALAHVKFSSPLRSGLNADLTLQIDGTKAHFRIAYNGNTIATGTMDLAP